MTSSQGKGTEHTAEDGTLVPPYPDRKDSGDALKEGPSYAEGVRVGGARGAVADDRMKAPAPDQTPGGRTASPADEQPAAASGGSAPDEGSSERGSHSAGVGRGEDSGDEAGRQDTGAQGASQRPTGTSTARDMTGVDPQDPVTTSPERSKG